MAGEDAKEALFTPRQWTSAHTFKASDQLSASDYKGPTALGPTALGPTPYEIRAPVRGALLLSRAIRRYAPRPRPPARAPDAVASQAAAQLKHVSRGEWHDKFQSIEDYPDQALAWASQEGPGATAVAQLEHISKTSHSKSQSINDSDFTEGRQAFAASEDSSAQPEGIPRVEQRPYSEYSRKSEASSADTVVQWEVLSDLSDDFDFEHVTEQSFHEADSLEHCERVFPTTNVIFNEPSVGCIRTCGDNHDMIELAAPSASFADNLDAAHTQFGALKLMRKGARPWSAGPKLATIEAGNSDLQVPVEQDAREVRTTRLCALGALRVGDGCPRAIRSRPGTPCGRAAVCLVQDRGIMSLRLASSSLCDTLVEAGIARASSSSSVSSSSSFFSPRVGAETWLNANPEARELPAVQRRKGSMPQYSIRAASASAKCGSSDGGQGGGAAGGGGGGGGTSVTGVRSVPIELSHSRDRSMQTRTATRCLIERPRSGNVLLKKLL
jgi:hypothetical protein